MRTDVWITSITAADGSVPEVELGPLVEALGASIFRYNWIPLLLDCYGNEQVHALCEEVQRARDDQGVIVLSSTDFLRFAQATRQTIDATFLAIPPGIEPTWDGLGGPFAQSQAEMEISVQDGIYFTVISRNRADIEAVMQGFPGACEVDAADYF